MHKPGSLRLVLALIAAVGLGACAGAPKPAPVLDLPKAPVEQLPVEIETWWQSFGDPVLNALVEEALVKNADVLVAAARIEEARAALRIATANQFPTGQLSYAPERNRSTLLGSQPLPSDVPRTTTTHRLGFTVAYELDLWGRLAAERAAARAILAGSTYARDGAQASVAAQVARSYFALRAFDLEVALLEETLGTREQSLDLHRQRFDAGLINNYEFSLAEAERAAVIAALPGLRAAREQAEVSLGAMIGRSPRELVELQVDRGKELTVLVDAPEIPADLPSDLLLRRPDVKAAEAQLTVAAYEVVKARTRWFPSISLTGFFGAESASLGDLLKSAASTWNVAALIAQPIFGLTQIGTEVRRTEALRLQSEITYQQAARQAYADALGALALHRGARETLVATREQVVIQTRVRALAEEQLSAGQVNRLDLLDAERQRLTVERLLVAAQRERLIALVNVYQALGGGWPQTPVPPPAEATTP
jgi:multidrug efflux system outer membrane protein